MERSALMPRGRSTVHGVCRQVRIMEPYQAQAGFLEEGEPWLILEGVGSGQVGKAGDHPIRGTRLRAAR